MAVRNMYTFFVVERVILRSSDQQIKMEIGEKIQSVRFQICWYSSNIKFINLS